MDVLAKTIKMQDHSPSMMLSMLPFKMILVPKENDKIPCNIANHGYTMTHPVPFTSKDRVAYQINGKTTMSKE